MSPPTAANSCQRGSTNRSQTINLLRSHTLQSAASGHKSATNDDAELALTIHSCDGQFTSSTNDYNESMDFRNAQPQETSCHSQWAEAKSAIRDTLYLMEPSR
jgi:hypothetical protein